MTEARDVVDIANEVADFVNYAALDLHFAHVEHQPQRIIKKKVFCRDCENPIPAARLAALPECFRCIDCQIAHEKEARL